MIENPSNSELRSFISQMPNARQTTWGSYCVRTRVTARSPQSTFIVSDETHSYPTITRAIYRDIEKLQNDFIKRQPMLAIRGWIGAEHPARVPVMIWVEKSHANIAAMQQQLLFTAGNNPQPAFQIIITPTLPAAGYPDGRLIAVDLENNTTRILGTDYFGESKKGGLRMWNKWIYDLGGLALHAGCKVYRDHKNREKSVLIIGLSGTGKTTTTFTRHLRSLPAQDDFCALFPGGKVFASENGCFAKTFGLEPERDALIYQALTRSDAYLENVRVDAQGWVDFADGSYTTNGRGTFSLKAIPHRSPLVLPPVSHIILLNRGQSVIPAIARLNREQAALYFMLGETTGTSAGGKSESGKALHVPGTNPFFFSDDALQGLRFFDLLESMPDTRVLLMNTGRIGGEASGQASLKVGVQDSSHLIEALLANEITWQPDGDFGYEIACPHPVLEVNAFLLMPRLFYQRNDRLEEYQQVVANLKASRRAFLDKFPQFREFRGISIEWFISAL